MLSAIHHVAIIGSDYERSMDFYVRKLGFEVLRENARPERGDVKIDLRLNDATEIELFIVPGAPRRVTRPEAMGLRHLAFYVENIEQAAEWLKSRGIDCGPIRDDVYTNRKCAFFFDPDGLPLEIHT